MESEGLPGGPAGDVMYERAQGRPLASRSLGMRLPDPAATRVVAVDGAGERRRRRSRSSRRRSRPGYAQLNRTYSKFTGWRLMPMTGGAIQLANLPGSTTRPIRLAT